MCILTRAWHSEQPLQPPRSSELAFSHLTTLKLFERLTFSSEFCSQTEQPLLLSLLIQAQLLAAMNDFLVEKKKHL